MRLHSIAGESILVSRETEGNSSAVKQVVEALFSDLPLGHRQIFLMAL